MPVREHSSPTSGDRIRLAGEVVLLLLAMGTVWPFASVQPEWEFVASVGVALLLVLWSAHALVVRQFQLRPDLVLLSLSGIVVLSLLQLVPLPLSVVQIVSPGAAEVHETFRPAVSETLPGESAGVPRPNWLPLSVDPSATRTFAIELTGLLLVYAAARNWIATPDAFRRLAWVATLNGLALALLAITQFFSSPGDTMFWSMSVGTSVYGTFVNRNHYTDYIAGCIGLGVGLMLTLRIVAPSTYKTRQKAEETNWRDQVLSPFKYLDQPLPLAAGASVALMIASVPFSLSRGGVLGIVVAGVITALLVRRQHKDARSGLGAWAMGITLTVAVGLVVWFGWGPIQARFATLAKKSGDDRTAMWRDAIRSTSGFWLVGSGNNTFLRTETLGRSDGTADLSNDHVHNEYLEALVEGGLIRFALTLTLVGGLLYQIAVGYYRQRGRPGASLLIGSWFGLAAVAAHAFTDFGIHLPAIALFQAVLAGYALAISQESALPRTRKKIRVRRRIVDAEPTPTPALPVAALSSPSANPAPEATSPTPVAAGERSYFERAFSVVVALTGIAIALDCWNRQESAALLEGAERFRMSDLARGPTGRLAYLTARTRLRPADPGVWLDLAQAYIDRGTPEDTRLALAALRVSRDLCPLSPEVQFRLGLFARSFARSDPPKVYFERARRLLVMDADVWYASGAELLRVGDDAEAWDAFRRSLKLSPRRLKSILAACHNLTSQQLIAQVLPDDPLLLTAAVNELYPNLDTDSANRKPILERIILAKDRPQLRVEAYVALAQAFGELGQIQEGLEAWRQALALDPERLATHDAFARWLETEELYSLAIPELEFLADRRSDSQAYRNRLLTAKHAARLQAEIHKK